MVVYRVYYRNSCKFHKRWNLLLHHLFQFCTISDVCGFAKYIVFHCFFAVGVDLLQFVSTTYLNNKVGWTFPLTAIDPLCYDLLPKKVFLLSSKQIDIIQACNFINLIHLADISRQAMSFCPSYIITYKKSFQS